MKFKSDIEVQAGLRDGGNDIGTAGQLLSSTGAVTNWIDQGDVVAAGATRVLIACKNTSGGTITKGTPVYQTGNVGATDVIEVAEADALISTGYLPAIGLLETDLINNAFGHVVITGELLNITTSPIDGVVPVTGDTVYLKSGGGLTLTKPTGEGNAIQNLGLVGKVSGGNAGSLTVASIMRQNDVPNLPEGRIWIGDGNTIVSDTVYVDEPNNRVGIGTTSPTAILDVYGNLRVGTTGNFTIAQSPFSTTVFYVGAGNGSTITFGAPASNTQDVSVQGDLYSYQGSIGTKLSGSFNNKISYNGDNYLNSGNLGIGTTSPRTKLHVSGLTGDDDPSLGSSTAPLFVSNTANSYGLNIGVNNVGASWLQSQSNTSATAYEMSLNPLGGNVGVGTTSPAKKLTIGGIGTNNTDGLKIEDPSNTAYGAHYSYSDANSTVEIGGVTNNVLNDCISIARDATRAITIRSSENVGIGTTSPVSKLQVNGGVQLANDTTSPSATKAGTFRYYTSGNNSYVDMCMQTGASTYAWVNIVTNSW